jgi:hypothetical protein
MSDKTTISRAFNSHFFEFIDDILRIFPENRELKDAKTAFELFKKFNPTSIIKAWQTFVYTPYKDVIEQGNITFFFDKDYRTDLDHIHNSGEIMKIIDKIREPIKNMGDSNKAHSTKYIQNLSKLSLLYNDACAM